MHEFGISNYWVFIISGIILNITPGADTIYILTRSISQGKSAGIASVLGISTGGLIHTLLAALGLSLVLSTSLLVFTIIKFAGAAYLIYLGIEMISSKGNLIIKENKNHRHLAFFKVYVQGILTNVFNPKVALFFLSFLPQFIDAPQTQGPLPFLILGLTFFTTGTVWCLMLALFASLITDKLRTNNRITGIMQKCSGLIIILLGMKLALSKK